MKTILVTGSREWDEYDVVHAALAEHGVPGGTLILHGAQPRGVDGMAARAALVLGYRVQAFPPRTWTAPDLLARNRAMVERGPGLALAFITPGARGTWFTANLALSKGIPTRFIGSKITEQDALTCHRAARQLAASGLTMKRQALWVQLSQVQPGDRTPWLVAAAREVLGGQEAAS